MSDGDVHVFSAPKQPATRFTVDVGDGIKPLVIRFAGRAQIRCRLCGKRHWAKYMSAQVYYDQTVYSCRGGCRRQGESR